MRDTSTTSSFVSSVLRNNTLQYLNNASFLPSPFSKLKSSKSSVPIFLTGKIFKKFGAVASCSSSNGWHITSRFTPSNFKTLIELVLPVFTSTFKPHKV